MKNFVPENHRTPIYRDAGFDQGSLASAEESFSKEASFPQSADLPIYTRYGNPSIVSVESSLSQIEKSEWSVVTSSGLAAIDVALGIFQKSSSDRRWLFLSELYGGTNAYIDQILVSRRGVRCERVFPDGEVYSTEKIVNSLRQHHPEVFFFEPVTNPLLICIDAEAVISAAKDVGSYVIVDNTFATSALIRPLDLGADLVVHSATKYLSGHGDLTAGVISGNDESFLRNALVYRKLTGCILSSDDAFRLESQLKTFTLRSQKHFDNAEKIARYLDGHANVERVRYPCLQSHETFDLANKLFGERGFGGVITFDIIGGKKECDNFFNQAIPKIRYVPTLGDVDTMFLHVQSTFGEAYKENSIRLSVGIEDVDVTIEVLGAALG